MKRQLYAVLSFLILSQTAVADDKRTPEELLKGQLNAAIEILQKKEMDQQAKNRKIVEIIDPLFDFSIMAKLALGKKYWPGLSKEKKERYTELFTNRLKTSYIDKLILYTDEKIVYKTPVQVKNKIHIPTGLISKDNNISMLYKFYKSNYGWKIYDVEIQGVSIVSSYRSQFKEVLGNGTIDDLLLKLEKPENK